MYELELPQQYATSSLALTCKGEMKGESGKLKFFVQRFLILEHEMSFSRPVEYT